MGLELARAFVLIGADSSRLRADLKHARRTTEDEMSGISDAAAGAGLAITAVLAAVAGAAASFAVSAAAQFEQTRIAFETMLGGADETTDVLDKLTEFAAKTPFEMPEILQAARGLIQFGERGDEMIETMNILGNAASGTSTSFGFLALVFNQIRGVGKLLTQDFRQLSTRGIISLKDIADHFDVTTAAAQKMLSSGNISFEDLKAILKGLSEEGGRFENLMEKQSVSFLGMVSTFKDNIGILARQLGTLLLPALKRVLAWFIRISDWMQAHSRTVATLVVGFGTLAAVLGLVLAATLAYTLATRLNILALAVQKAFQGPKGWVVLAIAIGVAVVAVNELTESFEAADAAAKAARESSADVVEDLPEFVGVQADLGKIVVKAQLKDAEAALEEAKALKDAGERFDAERKARVRLLEVKVVARRKGIIGDEAKEEDKKGGREIALFRTGKAAAQIEKLQNALKEMGLRESTQLMLKFARSTNATIQEQQEFMDLLKQQAALVITKNLEEMNVQLLMTEDRFTAAQQALADFASQETVTDAQIESFEKMQKRLQELDARSTLDDMAEELFKLRNNATAADRAVRDFATREGVTREQIQRFRDMRTEIDKFAKLDELKRSGKDLAKSLRTPFQVYRDEVMRINEMLAKGFITQEIAVKAVLGAQKQALDQQKLIGAGRSGFVQFGKSIQDAILRNTDKDFKREQIGLLKAGLKKQDELIKAVEEDKNKPAVLI